MLLWILIRLLGSEFLITLCPLWFSFLSPDSVALHPGYETLKILTNPGFRCASSRLQGIPDIRESVLFAVDNEILRDQAGHVFDDAHLARLVETDVSQHQVADGGPGIAV
jgi:hypothetical protein